jgi:hypothetical protein
VLLRHGGLIAPAYCFGGWMMMDDDYDIDFEDSDDDSADVDVEVSGYESSYELMDKGRYAELSAKLRIRRQLEDLAEVRRMRDEIDYLL